MQATLDSTSLKHLTRALICVSKYGDDLTLCVTSQYFSISSTNSSMSAYCRFKYGRQFFSNFNVGPKNGTANSSLYDNQEVQPVTGQLLAKSLLSVLRHRTVEKTVDKCELSIVDGAVSSQDAGSDSDADTLESRLIVRLHCKHGVVKTHRLLLQTPNSVLAPGVPQSPTESRLTIGPRALRDMIDHFPNAKGVRSDPQLIWSFEDSEVRVKSLETSTDSKGRAQLATELTMSPDEFDVYDIFVTPTTIAFHLREFNATIAFAEASSLPLEIRFTESAAPLFIEVDGDLADTLFVISTSQVGAAGGIASQARHVNNARADVLNNGKKRALEDDSEAGMANSRTVERRKPMKAAQVIDRASVLRDGDDNMGSMPPPPSIPMPYQSTPIPRSSLRMPPPPAHPAPVREPLFLPSSSQLSQADQDVIRQSGLGVDNMTQAEFDALFEADDDLEEEMNVDADQGGVSGYEPGHAQEDVLVEDERQDSFDLYDEVEMEPTQDSRGAKGFKPLFED